MLSNLIFFVPIAIVVLAVLGAAIKVLREYERGVVFTLGRFTGVKGPGLILLFPVIQQMVRVDLRTLVLDVPSQDVISRDNVSVKVNAVLYFRVVDPEKATIQVENYMRATSQLANFHPGRTAMRDRPDAFCGMIAAASHCRCPDSPLSSPGYSASRWRSRTTR